MQTQNTIDIYSTVSYIVPVLLNSILRPVILQDMELLHSITHPSRLHDIKFCKSVDGEGELLLAGGEDKKLSVYEVYKDHTKVPTIIADMVGHTNRCVLL